MVIVVLMTAWHRGPGPGLGPGPGSRFLAVLAVVMAMLTMVVAMAEGRRGGGGLGMLDNSRKNMRSPCKDFSKALPAPLEVMKGCDCYSLAQSLTHSLTHSLF